MNVVRAFVRFHRLHVRHLTTKISRNEVPIKTCPQHCKHSLIAHPTV